jgi:TonB family protein
VPDSRAPAPAPAPAKARRASPPSSAAAPKEKPPETEAARPKEPKPEKSEDLSKLEKRIFAGRAAPGMPKLPEHLVGTDSVPAAAPKGLSDEVISEWIKKYKGGIQSCYARQLKKDPSVKGKLTLNLKIGKNGRVKSAGVEDAMKNTEVGQCVVRVARTWRFPQSGDDADIYYPLVFEKTY